MEVANDSACVHVVIRSRLSTGTFLLCAKFPAVYPSKPPEVRFLTPVSVPLKTSMETAFCV